MLKKIGIITPYHDNYGGAEIYVKEIEDYMNNVNKICDCYILTSDVDKFKFNKHIEIPKINRYKLLNKNIFKIIKILKINNIDTIILNDFYISSYAVIFKILGFKVISLIHAEIKDEIKGKKSKIGKFIRSIRFKLINIGSNRILSVNKTNLKKFTAYKTEYIGNFIDVNSMIVNKEYKKIYDFIFVGRLTEVKNINYMIKIFDIYVNKIDKNSKLLIVGDGELYNIIKYQISKLKLEKNIILTGNKDRNDIFEYYRKSKCLLLFSKSEGFPTVILEALANEVPCIVSNVGSNSDVIINDVNGYVIYDILDINNIVNKMSFIIENYEIYNEECINSCKKWDKNIILRKIEGIII